jgi:hypothetical protein
LSVLYHFLHALESGWAAAELVTSLLCLAASVACVVIFARLLRRKTLGWSPGKITAVGLAGLLLPAVLLCLPEAVDWLSYLRSCDMVERSLLGVDVQPDQRAALMAHAISDGFNVSWLARTGQVLLLIPCALLAGLSMALLTGSHGEGKP